VAIAETVTEGRGSPAKADLTGACAVRVLESRLSRIRQKFRFPYTFVYLYKRTSEDSTLTLARTDWTLIERTLLLQGPSGYKLRAPYLTVRKPWTEQDDITDDEELERKAVTPRTADDKGGAEEETYGPSAGDKAYVKYTKNPGFWEPGALLCVQNVGTHERSSTRRLALEPGCISQLAPNLAHDGRTKFSDADSPMCRYALQSWFFCVFAEVEQATRLPLIMFLRARPRVLTLSADSFRPAVMRASRPSLSRHLSSPACTHCR
jgi:hypothetical protein